jgi:DNA-binding response OmpR family regulator
MTDLKKSEQQGPRVLVVEDDELMRLAVEDALSCAGFQVHAVSDLASFDSAYAAFQPALVVVDWGLGDAEGIEIVRHLAAAAGVGVLMLTARGSLEHRLQGLETGADAYMVKPVDWRELVLTLQALHRRLASVGDRRDNAFSFEPRQFQLRSPGGHLVVLNAQECMLIECLLRRPGDVVAKETLMGVLGTHEDAWGEPRLAQTVSRLRRKLEAMEPGWQPLRTVHRVGYAFDPASQIGSTSQEPSRP